MHNSAVEMFASTEPLRIYTLGRFSVVCNGERVTFSGKAQARPLDLLGALIALGGRDVGKHKLVEALWRESADQDSVLGSTLHRLRRLLSDERAVVINAGCISLAPGRVWVDAWEVEKAVGRFENAAYSIAEMDGVWRRLADLYQGHFLERTCDHPWALPYRRRLRSKYLRVVVGLGEAMEKEQRWNRAGDIYRAALERDPFSERLNYRLMRCYLQAGLPVEAVRLYREYAELSQKCLDVVPGEQIQKLYLTTIQDRSRAG